MKPSRKMMLIGGAVLTVVLLLLLIARSRSHKGASAIKVQWTHPVQGQLIEFVNAPGQVEPKTNVEIRAKVSARIVELPFDEGDCVTKGDPDADPPIPASVLVRLDDKDLEENLRSAQANRAAQAAQIEVETERISSQRESLTGTLASLRQAQADLDRQRQLLASKDVSQSVYDDAKLNYDELAARYASAQHDLKAAELNLQVLRHRLEEADARISQAEDALSNTVIHSPIDGIVTRLNAEVGELVMTGTMNNAASVILEVADLSRMLVVAEVGEADVGKLRTGQKATAQVRAYPDDEFTGVVDSIALMHHTSNNGTKVFRTEIVLDADPNIAKLYSGLTAHVEIETLKHEGVLVLPSQAILGREVDGLPQAMRETCAEVEKDKTMTPVVYRIADGKAVVTPIRIGPSNLTDTIIKAGLTPDDRVVVGPYRILDGLKHDQAIEPETSGDTPKTTPEPNEANDVS